MGLVAEKRSPVDLGRADTEKVSTGRCDETLELIVELVSESTELLKVVMANAGTWELLGGRLIMPLLDINPANPADCVLANEFAVELATIGDD